MDALSEIALPVLPAFEELLAQPAAPTATAAAPNVLRPRKLLRETGGIEVFI